MDDVIPFICYSSINVDHVDHVVYVVPQLSFSHLNVVRNCFFFRTLFLHFLPFFVDSFDRIAPLFFYLKPNHWKVTKQMPSVRAFMGKFSFKSFDLNKHVAEGGMERWNWGNVLWFVDSCCQSFSRILVPVMWLWNFGGDLLLAINLLKKFHGY